MKETNELTRCSWANHSPLEIHYHDEEWGKPVHEDAKLFEMLVLEGQQAGLSWSTILAKREHMRKAFDNFDPAILAAYDEKKLEELLQDPGIIRNRLKVKSLVENAKAYYKVKEQYGSLDNFLWCYVNFTPILNHWTELTQVPAKTELSDRISKDMKKLGFKFVGSTIIYAFMQAVGMVNDHLTSCFLYKS